MKARVLPALLLAVLVIGAWQLIDREVPSPDQRPGFDLIENASTEPVQGEVQLGSTDADPLTSVGNERRVEVSAASEVAPAQRIFQAPRLSGTGTLGVRIVERTGGEPVGGAEVAVVGPTDEDLRWIWELGGGSYRGRRIGYWAPLMGSLLRGDGVRNGDEGHVAWYRADDAGRLWIPRLSNGLVLVAERDGQCEGLLHVTGELSRAGAEIEMLIGPTKTLEVRVRDQAGKPVSGVYVEPAALGSAEGIDSIVAQMGQTSDGQGRCQYRVADLVLPLLLGSESIELVASPMGPELRRAVNLLELPNDPVLFEVPTGVVADVFVTDSDGQPADGPAYQVQVKNPADWSRVTGWPQSGLCRLEGLPPGVEVNVSVWFADDQTSDALTVTLPTKPGSHLRVDLVLPQPTVKIVGRFVDREGAPLSMIEYAGKLRGRPQGNWNFRRRLADIEGRFEIRANWELTKPLIGVSLNLELSENGGAVATFPRTEFAWSPEEGAMDIGDLVAIPLPVIAAGVVVDQDGGPVAGARVQVETEGSGYMRVGRSSDATRWGTRDFWTHIGAQPCLTDESGPLEVRGELSGLEIRLLAFREGSSYRFPELETHEGARGLRLVMDEAGVVSGAVELPATEDMELWYVVLAPSGQLDPSPAFSNETRPLETGGAFTIPNVAPGLHDLFVMQRGLVEPKVVVEGLLVEAGKVCGDERLWRIAPLLAMVPLALEVIAPTDQTVTTGEVFVRQSGQFEKLSVFRQWLPAGGRGTLELFVPELPVELLVVVDGCRDLHLESVDQDLTLQLEPGLAIELALPKGVDPSEDLSIVIHRVPDIETQRSQFLGEETFDTKGRYQTTLGGPGKYLALAFLDQSGPSIELVGSLEFEVLESSSLQSFELEPR